MNKLFLFLSFLIASFFLAQEIKWYSFDEAIKAQKKSPKKIFVDVYAPWCGPCRMMDNTTFKHPEIVKIINENFYPVKFNGEGNEVVHYNNMAFSNPKYRANVSGRNSIHDFTKYLGVSAYPSIIFFDENSNLITNLMGGFTAKEIEPYLNFIHTDAYKKVTTKEQWDNFQKKFKSNIKD